MENFLIKIINLKKYYKSKKQLIKALDDVSFFINKEEVFGLLGANGAGKTTLSSILATLHPPTQGDVIFGNDSIYKDINSYRRQMSFCPQKANLINELTVEQNLLFAGRYFNMNEEQIKIRMKELEEEFELSKYLKLKPNVLSGGYKQRVSIARSVIHKPRLLILDEPTVGLDPHIRHKLWESIRNLKKEGTTVLLTTHYIDEAEILSDRICILDKGKIKVIDTPHNLNTIYQKSKLEDVFLQIMHEEKEND